MYTGKAKGLSISFEEFCFTRTENTVKWVQKRFKATRALDWKTGVSPATSGFTEEEVTVQWTSSRKISNNDVKIDYHEVLNKLRLSQTSHPNTSAMGLSETHFQDIWTKKELEVFQGFCQINESHRSKLDRNTCLQSQNSKKWQNLENCFSK